MQTAVDLLFWGKLLIWAGVFALTAYLCVAITRTWWGTRPYSRRVKSFLAEYAALERRKSSIGRSLTMRDCPNLLAIWLSIFDPAQIGELKKELIGHHCGRCHVCGTRYNLLVRAGKERYIKQLMAEGSRAASQGPRSTTRE